MNRKIRDSRRGKRINPGRGEKKITPEIVAEGLNAEIIAKTSRPFTDPFSFLSLHQRMATELRSTGGRPSRMGVSGRRKVPMSDQEWGDLEHLALLFTSLGLNVSPGQVAGFLLENSLEQIKSEIEKIETEEGQILEAAANSKGGLQKLAPVAKEMLNRMKLEKLKELIPAISAKEN